MHIQVEIVLICKRWHSRCPIFYKSWLWY